MLPQMIYKCAAHQLWWCIWTSEIRVFSRSGCLCTLQGQFRWIYCPLRWYRLKATSIKDVTINKGINTEVVSLLLAAVVPFGSKNSSLWVRFSREGKDQQRGGWETVSDGISTTYKTKRVFETDHKFEWLCCLHGNCFGQWGDSEM